MLMLQDLAASQVIDCGSHYPCTGSTGLPVPSRISTIKSSLSVSGKLNAIECIMCRISVWPGQAMRN